MLAVVNTGFNGDGVGFDAICCRWLILAYGLQRLLVQYGITRATQEDGVLAKRPVRVYHKTDFDLAGGLGQTGPSLKTYIKIGAVFFGGEVGDAGFLLNGLLPLDQVVGIFPSGSVEAGIAVALPDGGGELIKAFLGKIEVGGVG
jgi:hypothetical protein